MPNGNRLTSVVRIVVAPVLITLAVTLLRLTGELRGWPRPWFDKDSGIVGITQALPPLFGSYFAWRLWRRGERIERLGQDRMKGDPADSSHGQ